MLKKLKNAATICLALIISFNSISNLYINVSAGDFFLGDGQLSGAPPIVDRIYNIRSFDDTDRYLQALNDGTSTQTSIKTAPYNGAAYQEWKISKVEGTDEYTIQDINSGKYLSILGSASNSGIPAYILDNANAPGQRFKIEQHFNASGNETPYYKILTKSSGYTLALGVDTSTHNILQMDKDSSQTIMALEEASFAKGVPDGYNYIQSKYYNADNRGFLCGTISVGQLTLNNFDPVFSKFNFIYLGNNYYKIMLNETLCITVTNTLVNNKCIVSYSTYTGADTQLWRVYSDDIYFRFQPKCAESSNSFLFCDSSGNIFLDNSEKGISRSHWRRFISDDYFEQIGAYLCGVNDSRHDLSHVDWIQNAMVKLYEKNTLNNYDQIKVDYGYNESINSNTFAEKFSECNLMIFRGHGGYSGESYLLLTPILTNGEYSESTATKYYSTDMSDIDVSNISCALFICCNSAQGSYSNQSISNFVTEGIENGINCVIGFDDTVYCSYAAEFLDTFLELYTGINNNDEHIDGGGTSYNVAFRQTINILGADNNMPFLSTQSYKIYYSDGLITEYYDE